MDSVVIYDAACACKATAMPLNQLAMAYSNTYFGTLYRIQGQRATITIISYHQRLGIPYAKWVVDLVLPIRSRTISAVNPESSGLRAIVNDLQAGEYQQVHSIMVLTSINSSFPCHDGTNQSCQL